MSNEFKALGGILAFGVALRLVVPKKYPVIDYINRTHRIGTYGTSSKEVITEITFHHSATPSDWTPEKIAKVHTDKGWPGIGYDFLIYDDGTIYQVNNLTTINYHNGVNNTNAIGICWVGDGRKGAPPKEVIKATVSLSRQLRRELPNLTKLFGHNEKKATTCPGPYVDLDALRKLTKLTK